MHISNSYSTSYTEFVKTGYHNTVRIQQDVSNQASVIATSQNDQGDRLSISLEARIKVNQSSGLNTVTKVGPDDFAKFARLRIEQLLDELEIPKDTPVTITTDSKGNIDFKTNHTDREKIEAALTEDAPLRDLVLAGRHAAGLERIEMTKNLAIENLPSGDDDAPGRAQEWLQEVIRDILKMPYFTYYNADAVSASFEDGKGDVVNYMNNMEAPKFT